MMTSEDTTATTQAAIRLARWTVFGLSGLTTAVGTWLLAGVLWETGPVGLIFSALVLFTIGTGWIALAFWTAIAGFLALRWHPRRSPDAEARSPQAQDSRTVVAIAIHNEDPDMVAGNIAAMVRSVRAAGRQDRVDFFILSDTTDPDIWVAEEKAWAGLCREFGGDSRIFYRKRPDTAGRKSGNIADFCRRWGRRYDYMVVLDADSLMEGSTIGALIDRMDAAPTVAMIQTAPVIVNGTSLFNRLLQFAGGTYGPVFTAGLALLSGPHGNSWGHNAIFRMEPFLRHCGLPRLRGRAPMGGDILSHDFVEAALLVRAGWEVRIAPDLGGSYEESPATMAAFARRDRRWCQGNLQHLRILFGPGLKGMSRFHLMSGIMSYAIAPVWLGFIAVGLVLDTVGAPGDGMLTVIGPLLVLVLCLLVGPRLVGLADSLLSGRSGRFFALVATPLEIALTAFLAPILMVHQCLAVVAVFAGHAVGWTTQRRNIASSYRREQMRLALPPFLAGVAITGLILFGAGAMDADGKPTGSLIWGLPVAIPLLAAPILIVLADSVWLGAATRAVGLFVAPAERSAPDVVAMALASRQAHHPNHQLVDRDGLRDVLSDPTLNAVHRRVLHVYHQGRPATVGRDRMRLLNDARFRLARGLPLDQAAKMALLTDPVSVIRPLMPRTPLADGLAFASATPTESRPIPAE